MIPTLACAYATIIGPFLDFAFDLAKSTSQLQPAEPGVTNRLFWPVLTAASFILAARKGRCLRSAALPPHIISFLLYVGFAGLSVVWAFKPQVSFVRFTQQAMVVTCIILPSLLAGPRVDLIRRMFLCFAVAALLNLVVIAGDNSLENARLGYPGYFLGKNYLGEFAGPALLLALHEAAYPGLRRVSGLIVATVALSLLFLSTSKTALALAFLCPVLAGAAMLIRRVTKASLAVILVQIPIWVAITSEAFNYSIYRFSSLLYGDPTLTGRTIIWEFAKNEISKRPLMGWGYQSFWLVGPDGPSVVDGPGWVKTMPEGHNGYYDARLEVGYLGFALLLIFILLVLHAIGRVADRHPRRAWSLLSLALFVIIYNLTESLWMRGSELLWVMFLMLVADLARYMQVSPLKSRLLGRYRQDSHSLSVSDHRRRSGAAAGSPAT